MSLRPKSTSDTGAAAFRVKLAQCTAAAHRWNLHGKALDVCNPAPSPACIDAGYSNFEEAYDMGRAPKWTWPYLVEEEDVRGRLDRDGTRKIPKEPDALQCQICSDDLDEKTSNTGHFEKQELEILQELTEEARKNNPNAPVVCGHVFHKNCLSRWIYNNGRTCPVCRSRIPIEVMSRLAPDLDLTEYSPDPDLLPGHGDSSEDDESHSEADSESPEEEVERFSSRINNILANRRTSNELNWPSFYLRSQESFEEYMLYEITEALGDMTDTSLQYELFKSQPRPFWRVAEDDGLGDVARWLMARENELSLLHGG